LRRLMLKTAGCWPLGAYPSRSSRSSAACSSPSACRSPLRVVTSTPRPYHWRASSIRPSRCRAWPP